MEILHVSCSPRGHASESHRLSQRIIELLLEREPHALLVKRVLGTGTLAHIDANYAEAQQSADAEVTQLGSIARSDELIAELERSDVIVIGTPMHNLSVPSALKAWIDHVVRARRTFSLTKHGKVGTLRDRPVFIAVSSGGRFSGEHAHQPDFLTPYLKAILGMIGLHDITFFSLEGTARNPAAVAAIRAATELAVDAHFCSPPPAKPEARLHLQRKDPS